MPGLKFTPEQIQEASKRRYQEWLARHKAAIAEKEMAKLAGFDRIPAVDLAYAAGIIDGEGAMVITRRPTRRTYRALITVAMCEPEATAFLWKTFGGHLMTRRIMHKNRPEHRPQDIWGVASNEAANVCRVVLPFLKIKSKQAQNIIELQKIHQQIRDSTTAQRKNRNTFGPARKGPFFVEQELLNRCEALKHSQNELNRRGKKVHEATAQIPNAASAATPINAGVLNPNEEAA